MLQLSLCQHFKNKTFKQRSWLISEIALGLIVTAYFWIIQKSNLAVLETGRQSFYIELYVSGADPKLQQGTGKKY